ncbi:MAG: RNA polymerase sigma-70 factor [Reichenbachiella sp.]|uniref:RNA polymerase sigma factor n=1 Tax=Reichenbachiella sp. TaxID=2184521 RepID=UPI0032991025
MKVLSEDRLVLMVKGGSHTAFEKLYEAYCHRLFKFAMKLLREQAYAEEVVQFVFLKVWENRERLNPELSFSAYVFQIAKNQILKTIKLRKDSFHAIEHVSKDLLGYSHVDEEINHNVVSDELGKVLNALPEQRRKVFVLSRFDGLAIKEIAKEMKLSVHTVKRHMNLALKSVRSNMLAYR